MIASFRCKETERIASGGISKRFPTDIQRRAKMRLDRLDAAAGLDDLRVPPSHRLEALAGNRAGQWSIRVNDQWRVCFVWQDGRAFEVELVDYH
jgi:proteic killer suppression protein